MSIYTPTNVVGDYLGVYKSVNKVSKFVPLAKAPVLIDVYECIEDDTVILKLVSPYYGRDKVAYIPRGDLLDPKLGKTLADLGFDLTTSLLGHCVDAIRLQEEDREVKNLPPTLAYESLGWIRIPCEDPTTGQITFQLCYRSNELKGSNQPAKYVGPYDIASVGRFEQWQQLMIDDVLPYPALQLVLVAALSAVIVGLLALRIPIENPLLHLNLPSGRGKSTAGYVATSTAGKPYEGTMPVIDKDGKVIEKQSVNQSWGATDNAMVSTQAGNRGVVTVLNELGKSLTKNMERLVFDLSEGSDKKRLTSSLKARVSKGYSTTFISTGESSLLEKCNTKLEGLAVRVMEIDAPLTKDAAHANRLKEGCFANCGFAAPMLAEYIIDKGGVDYVLPIYKGWVRKLRARFPKTPNMDRFVEKFAALFVTTAEVAAKALNLPFDVSGLLDFMEEYDRAHGAARNTSFNSYDLIIQHCRIQHHKFYLRHDKSLPKARIAQNTVVAPTQECWGRITNMAKNHTNGQLIIQEFEIRKTILEELLKKYGFSSKSTCVEAWKAAEVLDFEDATHATRSRKIDLTAADGATEAVYVFRVFADAAEAAAIRKELAEEAKKAAERKKRQQRRMRKLVGESKDGVKSA